MYLFLSPATPKETEGRLRSPWDGEYLGNKRIIANILIGSIVRSYPITLGGFKFKKKVMEGGKDLFTLLFFKVSPGRLVSMAIPAVANTTIMSLGIFDLCGMSSFICSSSTQCTTRKARPSPLFDFAGSLIA